MDTYLCPKGHTSTEADYCSECGAKINGASSPGAAPGVAAAPEVCPDCGAAREPHDATFCEICGYNFLTGARGEIPVAETTAPEATIPEPTMSEAAAPAPTLSVPQAWELTVTVDPTLREAGSPEAPVGIGPFVFSLTEAVSLVGRRSETRAIFPEIPLTHDDAVSHRHALLQLDPASALLLRDIGASNGTRLNGKEITPMVDYPLNEGDEITLGHWSRITVRTVGAQPSEI